MIELFKEIWSTAKRNKLRTSLTGFAVAWGIFMLIFLLGAGNGLINAQLQQSNRRLANSIQVWGGYTSKAHKGLKEGRRVALNDRDVKITDETFTQHVEDVGAIVSKEGVNISYGENYVSAQKLSGVYPLSMKLNKREMLAGRFINDIDMEQQRKSIVLMKSQAKELVDNPADIIGKDVKIGDLMFKVVGVCKDDQQQQNTEAYTAYTTLKTIYGIGDEAHSIEFAIKNLPTEEDNNEFAKDYRAKINTLHDAAPDDESSIWIWNRYIDNIQMTNGISIIRTALWVIGLFTLLSGIVGVSNIMLITVKERTREFGVRKAIGAKPWQILKLIITESVITTAIFGYIGMLCGIAANEYMDATIGHDVIDTGLFQATMFVDPTVGLDVCIQATMVIIIAGTIAGLIPALKAARVRPIEALRAE
ncbi:MAG: ABC transporter permease [Prevotella sp.]